MLLEKEQATFNFSVSLGKRNGYNSIRVDSEVVLDVCARESYELPSNAGFVLDLKTPWFCRI